MKKFITRTVVLWMAFGFLYGCAPTADLQQVDRLKDNNELNAALETVLAITEREPRNAQAHLRAGEVYHLLAVQRDPASAKTYYSGMSASLARAVEHASESEYVSINQRSSELINSAFEREFEKASELIEIADNENGEAGDMAILHLENARAISPGHPEVLELLFDMYYSSEEQDKAAGILSELSQVSGLTRNQYELLGYYSYQSQNFESAVRYLTNAWDDGRGSANAGRGLSNALAALEQYEEQYHVLEQLVGIEPNEPLNHIAFGRNISTQIQLALEDLREASGLMEVENQMQYLFSLMEQAEQAFATAVDFDPLNPELNLAAGLYYFNTVILLESVFEDQPLMLHEDEFEELASRYYAESRQKLESAVDHDDQGKTAWRALGYVYDQLGMPDQAESARDKAQP